MRHRRPGMVGGEDAGPASRQGSRVGVRGGVVRRARDRRAETIVKERVFKTDRAMPGWVLIWPPESRLRFSPDCDWSTRAGWATDDRSRSHSCRNWSTRTRGAWACLYKRGGPGGHLIQGFPATANMARAGNARVSKGIIPDKRIDENGEQTSRLL